MWLWYILSPPCACRMKIHRGYSPYFDHIHLASVRHGRNSTKACSNARYKITTNYLGPLWLVFVSLVAGPLSLLWCEYQTGSPHVHLGAKLKIKIMALEWKMSVVGYCGTWTVESEILFVEDGNWGDDVLQDPWGVLFQRIRIFTVSWSYTSS
jgi:hypothetical protein